MPRTRLPFGTLGTDQSQFNGDGAFQRLHNLAQREPNMVEPLPGRDEIASAIGSSGNSTRRAWALTESDQYELLQLGGSVRELATLGPGGTLLPTVASDTLLGDTCGVAEARQRVLYAGPRGALVIESDSSEARMVGMLQPTFLAVVSSTTTDAQAIPAASRAAWRATLHRKHADGYEITSAPSYSVYGEDAGAGARDYTMRVGWVDVGSASDERVREGDIVRLWRSRAVTYQTSTNDRYQLTDEVVLDATAIANRYVDIRDITPDAALAGREELYTNPGAQGALQTNWQLGPCTDVAVYNGHAFYAQRSLPSYAKLAISSGVGALTGAARIANGIGVRAFTATTTLGNGTVTAVSSTAGLVAGQMVVGTLNGDFPNGTTITSVNHGASTVTFSALSGGAHTPEAFAVSDTARFTIEGVLGPRLRFASLVTLAHDLWDENVPVILSTDDIANGELFDFGTSLPVTSGVDADGIELRFDAIAPYGSTASDIGYQLTNSANYSPAPASDSTTVAGSIDERLNRLMWSKLDQPDHVPAVNELTVGKGEIIRLLSTKDVLFAFCTDGVHAVTGIGPDWSVDRVDKDIVIASQQAVYEMNGNAYVYAKDRGLLRIDRGGAVTGLTKGAIQKALDERIAAVASDGNVYEAHVVCDALHDEVGVFFPGVVGEAPSAGPLVYMFSERTSTWRTQTPGVLDAGDSEIECWCYSPKRRSLVWGQARIAYQNLPDDDLTSPIPGATLTTYPYVPDGDAVAMKRFHEAAFTISNLDTTDAGTMVFVVSAGARGLGETTDSPKALPGNEVATVDPPIVPALFQMRHMVTRQCAVNGHLVLNFAPENLTTRWRLHAIDVTWEPVSARSVNR